MALANNGLDQLGGDTDRRLQLLEQQSDRDRRALDALRNISVACRGFTTYRQIFQITARELCTVIPFDAFYIAVADTEKTDTFQTLLRVDEGLEEYDEAVPFGVLTGDVIHRRQPRRYDDLALERPTFSRPPDPFGNTAKLSRSWMGVPLLVGNDALGVISMQSYEPNRYNDADIELLQRVSDVVAVAIENAWLDQQQRALSGELATQVATRNEELRTLSLIAAELVLQRPLPELLLSALDVVLPLFGLEAATVRRYNPLRGLLSLIAQRGFSDDYNQAGLDLPIGGLPGQIVQDNKPVVIAQGVGAQAPEEIASYLPYESMLGVPLCIGERVLGTLSMFGRQVREFSQHEIDLAQALGNQMAIAIENANLFGAQKRQIRELDASSQIGQLISASYDFEEMLNGVYQTLNEVCHPSVFYLLLCEPQSGIVTHAIFIEGGERVVLDWIGHPPTSGSITEWILRNHEPLLFHDLPAQRESLLVRGIRPRAIGPDNPVRSWVGVPIIAQNNVSIGVLALQDYESHRYDDQTIDLLSQIANHVSLGVQKVELFEGRERQIRENERLIAAEQAARRTADTLREVARVLSTTFDYRELLELMLRELRQVIPYDTASVMLLDRDTLRIAASQGFTPNQLDRDMFLRGQTSGAALVVRSGQAQIIADTAEDHEWMQRPSSDHIRAWLGVPLIVKNVVLGVLNIDSRQPNYFTGRELEVAQAFASQAAIALENARLYEDSVARVEQELVIARQIQANLIPQHLPRFGGLELDARCIPARETGGDFFDFVSLEHGDLALMIGDASGKSIPGAMLMAIAHSIVRSEARDHQQPATVVRETNEWIAQDVPARSFVALCYATIDRERRRLSLANAGQLTPLRRRTTGEIDYLETPGPRLPLGIISSARYEALDVELAAGDLLVFFTDGIVEAQNANHDLFGFERVEELLAQYGDMSPETVINEVLAAVSAFAGDTPPHDDMTILVLRIV